MNYRRLLRLKVLATCMAASTGACNPAPCVENDLKEGVRYRVTLLELYNEDSTLAAWDPEFSPQNAQTCERLIVPPMTSFSLTTIEQHSANYPGSCTAWEVELEQLDGVRIVENIPYTSWGQPQGDYQPVAGTLANIELEGCTRPWTLGVLAKPGASIFRTPLPTELPPILIARDSSGKGESETCGDAFGPCLEHWIGTIERIE